MSGTLLNSYLRVLSLVGQTVRALDESTAKVRNRVGSYVSRAMSVVYKAVEDLNFEHLNMEHEVVTDACRT